MKKCYAIILALFFSLSSFAIPLLEFSLQPPVLMPEDRPTRIVQSFNYSTTMARPFARTEQFSGNVSFSYQLIEGLQLGLGLAVGGLSNDMFGYGITHTVFDVDGRILYMGPLVQNRYYMGIEFRPAYTHDFTIKTGYFNMSLGIPSSFRFKPIWWGYFVPSLTINNELLSPSLAGILGKNVGLDFLLGTAVYVKMLWIIFDFKFRFDNVSLIGNHDETKMVFKIGIGFDV